MKNLNSVKTGTLSVERREFLKKIGSYTAMSMFGIAFFTACSKDDNTTNQNPLPNNPNNPTDNGITITNTSVTIDLNKVTTLKNTGGWLLITSASILVINLGNSFSSLTSVCTHSGCDKNWSMSNNEFTCTCHGSKFASNGTVLVGPATTPLKQFTNSRVGDLLTINRS